MLRNDRKCKYIYICIYILENLNINSLAPGKFEWNFRYLILYMISMIDGWGISCELALRWMSLDLTDDKSSLVQVMAWCRQATSHYLSQCWPRSLSPYDVTRPQWVNVEAVHMTCKLACHFRWLKIQACCEIIWTSPAGHVGLNDGIDKSARML